VEVRRDFDSWTPQGEGDPSKASHTTGIAAGDRHGVPDHGAEDHPRHRVTNGASNGNGNGNGNGTAAGSSVDEKDLEKQNHRASPTVLGVADDLA